jgi:2'-5' RNA ligase
MEREGGTKRLFVAADIDDATKAQIEIISRSLRQAIGAGTRASWVRADRVHLTLQFFAAADAALEERIKAALGGALAARAFDLSFDGLGCFPERGSPRVLWLGIRNGEAELRHVQQIVRGRLALPPEPFTPHLTLARFRERMSRGSMGEIAGFRARAGPSRIDRVTLYESRLSPGGPMYFRLAEAPLGL